MGGTLGASIGPPWALLVEVEVYEDERAEEDSVVEKGVWGEMDVAYEDEAGPPIGSATGLKGLCGCGCNEESGIGIAPGCWVCCWGVTSPGVTLSAPGVSSEVTVASARPSSLARSTLVHQSVTSAEESART